MFKKLIIKYINKFKHRKWYKKRQKEELVKLERITIQLEIIRNWNEAIKNQIQ